MKNVLPVVALVFLAIGIWLLFYFKSDAGANEVPTPPDVVEPVKPRPHIFKPKPDPDPGSPGSQGTDSVVIPNNEPECTSTECTGPECSCGVETKPKQYTPVDANGWELVPSLPEPTGDKKIDKVTVSVDSSSDQNTTAKTIHRRTRRR
jgi:hypothetical protein